MAPNDARAVREYQVEYRTNPAAAWVNVPRRVPHSERQREFSATVDGLLPNGNVEFRVRAIGESTIE